jgi:hypothetical protein
MDFEALRGLLRRVAEEVEEESRWRRSWLRLGARAGELSAVGDILTRISGL